MPTSSRSLRNRLPLLISALLFVVVAVVCWSAHRQLVQMLMESTSRRLIGVSGQLAGMIEPSTAPTLSAVGRVAARPELTGWLRGQDEGGADSVRALLEAERARGAVGESLALWSGDGRRLLAVGPLASLAESSLLPLPTRSGAGGSAVAHGPWVAPLVLTELGVMSRVVAPVVDAGRDTLAILIASRHVAGTGVRQIRALIGSDAALMVGNSSGDLWTDLTEPVVGPSTGPAPGVLTGYTRGDGMRWLGVAAPIQNTPWLVWVQLPRDAVLAPAWSFVRDVAIAALAMMAVGVLVAWRLSDRVTAPIVEMSVAARDLAGGNYARRVSVRGRDELGVLASSFNSMATQVEAATRELQLHAYEMETANAELRESELRYRQLVEMLPDAVIVHRDLTIILANAEALTLTGTGSIGELVGRSLAEFVPEAAVEGLAGRARQVQHGMQSLPAVEREIRRPDGTVRVVESASTPFVHDGSGAVLSIFRDITERRRLEGRVRQAQKMEAVGQLAGGVAHDFNNLLTVIMSYSGVMLAELPADSPARADLQEIADAGTRAAALTRQLLAVSRQQVLEPRVVDLNEVIADMERMLRRVLPADIRIVVRLDPSLGHTRADPGQLEQVLMNLAVNARDAMPEGGTLLIETANAELDEDDGQLHAGAGAGPYLLLTITDTGVGMTAEEQQRAFDPFFTTKEPGQGTGLGLATVYGIVKQSGGHIGVYSEPGQGTVFRIYLPEVEGPAEERRARRPAVAAATGGMETILLVDDDPAVRAAARRILENAGYSVLVASSGAEALQLGERYGESIQLLLTDMVMPDMTGRELASRLQDALPGARTAFMSGYTEDVMLRQRVGPEGSVFIQKPFTPHGLTRALRTALDGREGGAGSEG